MGMAASQARLLSITARLSDNEQSSQALAFAKERLADKSEQITDEYNNALAATKLQIMTGFANGAADFSDVSFAMLSSPQVITLGKQYIVTNPQGKVLVTSDVAEAFINSQGSCNMFLGALGFALSDVNPTLKSTDADADDAEHMAIVQQIHEAWDRYFVSIGKREFYYDALDEDNQNQEMHPWQLDFVNRSDNIGDGYATLTMLQDDGNGNLVNASVDILNYEGTNQEQLDLYNYAMSITESYYSKTDDYGEAHDFNTIKTNYSKDNTAEITYYKNLFNKMLLSGFYSYTNNGLLAHDDPEHWIFEAENNGIGNVDSSPLTDAHTFEQYLKDGKLILQNFSTQRKKFEKVTLSSDTCFQEVQDKTKIAQAEAKYTKDLAQLERLDSRYDLQLKRLDTEHNTLQTEYEAVKKCISKNVESSFKLFS